MMTGVKTGYIFGIIASAPACLPIWGFQSFLSFGMMIGVVAVFLGSIFDLHRDHSVRVHRIAIFHFTVLLALIWFLLPVTFIIFSDSFSAIARFGTLFLAVAAVWGVRLTLQRFPRNLSVAILIGSITLFVLDLTALRDLTLAKELKQRGDTDRIEWLLFLGGHTPFRFSRFYPRFPSVLVSLAERNELNLFVMAADNEYSINGSTTAAVSRTFATRYNQAILPLVLSGCHLEQAIYSSVENLDRNVFHVYAGQLDKHAKRCREFGDRYMFSILAQKAIYAQHQAALEFALQRYQSMPQSNRVVADEGPMLKPFIYANNSQKDGYSFATFKAEVVPFWKKVRAAADNVNASFFQEYNGTLMHQIAYRAECGSKQESKQALKYFSTNGLDANIRTSSGETTLDILEKVLAGCIEPHEFAFLRR